MANIAAEEYSHIELVAAAINLLLTGTTKRADRSLASSTIRVGLAIALCASSQNIFAADENGIKATAAEKTFIKNAANGGMTEVNLGKLAAGKGESQEVKDFGNQMVKDHSTIMVMAHEKALLRPKRRAKRNISR